MGKKIFDEEGNQIGELREEQKKVFTDDWDEWQSTFIIWAFLGIAAWFTCKVEWWICFAVVCALGIGWGGLTIAIWKSQRDECMQFFLSI